LTRLGVNGDWPIWGKPRLIYVDNGAEFHSEALSRGCAQHSIALDYRPGGQPHYGGIVERLIGTLMQKVHGLPGTTFSNVVERGTYDADGKAILTLAELERWLTLVIVGQYHLTVHDTLKEPPIERFKAGLLGTSGHGGPGPKPLIQNKKSFLVDFLPIARRTIQRAGFVLDHVGYYSNALQPWIAERAKGQKFIIRRDPRDISRIFVKHPDHDEYLEVPYRTLNRPAVTLWEHRESVRQLHAAGRQKVDERAIFRTIDALRMLTAEAAEKSRAARRRQARRILAVEQIAQESGPPLPHPQTVPSPERGAPKPSASPFADLEEW
jgi:putative transposase